MSEQEYFFLRNQDEQDWWNERMAICTIDGRQSEEQAEQIARDEIEKRRE